MKNVTLNTGAKMPMLGLGVFRVEDSDGGGRKAMMAAFEAGYRSIDTAAAYNNERLVGEAVRESGLGREEIFVTTKLSNTAQRGGDVEAAFSLSLSELGMDYVDLYLIHWPVPETFVATWLVLEKIYKSGRAKAVGVSNFLPRHIAEIKKVWSVVPAINQIELHPMLTQKPLLGVCKAEGITPQSWSPLGGGKDLAGRLLGSDVLLGIAKKYGKTVAQVILRWNIELGIVAIPKSVTPSRISENIGIFDFELTSEEISAIDALNSDERSGPDPDNFHHAF
jgi:diketogulonate reductase-like aldo/keto reductase